MTLGNIIIELRKEQNLSQQKLADAIGISQAAIAKIEIERNEATASTIRKLSDYFQVSSDYLLGLEDDFGVRTAAPIGDAYSSEEQRLISVYRSLSPDLRQTLWNLLATWTPTETFKTPQKKRS